MEPICEEKKKGKKLRFEIVTPEGTAFSGECDSLVMPLADDENGEGGGSIGIHVGHEKVYCALQKGTVKAVENGKPIIECEIVPGVAAVEPDSATVLTEHAAQKAKKAN